MTASLILRKLGAYPRPAKLRLLFYPQNRVLCGLGNTKFDDGLGWNLDLLLRLWIKARARFSLLLHQLAKTGQDKFAVLSSALSVSRNTPAVLLSVWVASASAL